MIIEVFWAQKLIYYLQVTIGTAGKATDLITQHVIMVKETEKLDRYGTVHILPRASIELAWVGSVFVELWGIRDGSRRTCAFPIVWWVDILCLVFLRTFHVLPWFAVLDAETTSQE
jgi:hypothetical protein